MGQEAFLSEQIIGLSESIDDRVAALLVAGTGITLTYNDIAGTLTIAASSSFDGSFAALTGKPTTLSGYGITDAQPLDSDLTAIAALTTTSFGRSLLTQADAAATRTTIGAGTGTISGSTGATDNRILRADGTGGSTLQSSGVTIDDSGNVGVGQTTPNVAIAIRRSGADLPALRLEDGDTTVPFTGVGFNPTLNANTIASWSASASASGGMAFSGFTNNTAAAYPVIFEGYHGSASPTKPVLSFSGNKTNGSTGAANLASSELIAGFFNGSVAGTAVVTISAAGAISASSATFTGLVAVGTYTVSTLPSAAANAGALAQVTDSSVTANGSAVSGGGANRVVVFSNGSTWDVAVA
jgi:hypothetical protein